MSGMESAAERACEAFTAAKGTVRGPGSWFKVEQPRIDAFAETTEDRQFIHIDPEACAERSPYGVPVAHGFLTLSLLAPLIETVPPPAGCEDGLAMTVNYGFEKVRFVSPVKVGSSIRLNAAVDQVELKDAATVQVTQRVTVEIEGETKPALVADWIIRYVYS